MARKFIHGIILLYKIRHYRSFFAKSSAGVSKLFNHITFFLCVFAFLIKKRRNIWANFILFKMLLNRLRNLFRMNKFDQLYIKYDVYFISFLNFNTIDQITSVQINKNSDSILIELTTLSVSRSHKWQTDCHQTSLNVFI